MPTEKALSERLLKALDELEICKNQLGFWTESIDELSEIQDAFSTFGKADLDKTTILDIGTDCIKPLYIALKFKPEKIIGIDEGLIPFASEIQRGSKLLTESTKIRFYNCSLFDEQKLSKILTRERVNKFDLVLVSKTLHHLRTAKCVAKDRDKKHKCTEDEKDCIYGFEEETIFAKLLELSKRVVVYECFAPNEEDEDKVRGRGGHFTVKEWKRIFGYLLAKYRVKFTHPQSLTLNKEMLNSLGSTLRKVDTLCFYVEDREKTKRYKPKCSQTSSTEKT